MLISKKRKVVSCILAFDDDYYLYERLPKEKSDIIIVFDLIDKNLDIKSKIPNDLEINLLIHEIEIDSSINFKIQIKHVFERILEFIKTVSLDLEDFIIFNRMNDVIFLNDSILRNKKYDFLPLAYQNYYWGNRFTDFTYNFGYPLFNGFNLVRKKTFMYSIENETYKLGSIQNTDIAGFSYYGLEGIEKFQRKIEFGFYDLPLYKSLSDLEKTKSESLPPLIWDYHRSNTLSFVPKATIFFEEKTPYKIREPKEIKICDNFIDGFTTIKKTSYPQNHLKVGDGEVYVFVPNKTFYNYSEKLYLTNELKKIILLSNPIDSDKVIIKTSDFEYEGLWSDLKNKPLV